jgi:Mitochondrial carrier protein
MSIPRKSDQRGHTMSLCDMSSSGWHNGARSSATLGPVITTYRYAVLSLLTLCIVQGMIDIRQCLERGAIASLGAIPGTLVAHPFDLVKILLQVNASATSPCMTVRSAAHKTRQAGMFRGLVPAIEQKILTRGLMFFCSELCTQIVKTQRRFPVIRPFGSVRLGADI